MIHKSYKYKLNLTKSQKATFEQWLSGCRFLYNVAKECREWAYKSYGVSLNYYDLANELKYCKKLEGYEWLRNISNGTLQDILQRQEKAYKAFFKSGANYPKWAKKHKFRSFVILFDSRCKDPQITYNRLKLPKIGSVKYYAHKPIKGKLKRATIIKELDGWFISVLCEVDSPVQFIPKAKNQSIGIDWGVKHFYTDSNGHHEANPCFYDKYKAEIRVLQRSLSRKRVGSHNWKNTNRQLNKLHSKIARSRKDWQHKLSYRIVRDNQMIFVEDLRIKNMTKSSKGTADNHGSMVKQKSGLNRSILDTAPYQFMCFLEYKSAWYQRTFKKVRAANTSRECNSCGYISKDNRTTQSTFRCVTCSHSKNADWNAAQNIEGRGLTSLVANVTH